MLEVVGKALGVLRVLHRTHLDAQGCGALLGLWVADDQTGQLVWELDGSVSALIAGAFDDLPEDFHRLMLILKFGKGTGFKELTSDQE